jgi:lipopolysaccharide export LptBFGC system permease protein LptF
VSKTLFWYIFKDLIWVFLLTSGALAGIMSFAGLMRPLTQQGLELAQMAQMLGFFLPAMTNYSWPVAALFATTFVYGRLASDNELLAMRAAGIGWLHILFPACLLAFVVFAASLAMMLFVVPANLLRAERVIYSNLAQLISTKIERDRRILFNSQGSDLTISARDAQVLTADPSNPRGQAVQLNNVTIVTYESNANDGEPKRPKEFFIARRAVAYIEMPADDAGPEADVLLSLRLEDGARFPVDESGEPRTARDGRAKNSISTVIGTQTTPFFPLESLVRETARFMPFGRLMTIRDHPEMSRRVGKLLVNFRKLDQQRQFLGDLQSQLEQRRSIVLRGENGVVRLDVPANTSIKLAGEKLFVTAGTPDEPRLQFRQDEGEGPFSALANRAEFTVFPNNDNGKLAVRVDLLDAVIANKQGYSAKQSINKSYVLPMSEAIRKLNETTAGEFLRDGRLERSRSKERLQGAYIRQQNHVEAELHSRFAFAVSCLVLILVGAVIGTWFRSGNFVSAFALSTIPAIICLLLIMTGQHMAENVPDAIVNLTAYANPLKAGLWTVWSGNIAVMVIGLFMLLKLRAT